MFAARPRSITTEYVNGIGLKLVEGESGSGKAYIGASLAEDNGRLIIRTIIAGTPAFEQGLNTGDQIVAVDGYRASLTFLQSYIGERKPGDKIRLTIFRFDKLREITFTLGSDVRKEYDFSSVADPLKIRKSCINSI